MVILSVQNQHENDSEVRCISNVLTMWCGRNGHFLVNSENNAVGTYSVALNCLPMGCTLPRGICRFPPFNFNPRGVPATLDK